MDELAMHRSGVLVNQNFELKSYVKDVSDKMTVSAIIN